MSVALAPRRVAAVLYAGTLALSLASAAGQLSKYVLDRGRLHGLVPLFYVGQPRNVPAWFMSSMLLACALLLAAIGDARRRAGARHARGWWRLTAVALLLSVDEATGLHETVLRAVGVRSVWPVAIFAAIAVGLGSVRLLASLPTAIRGRLLAGGIAYAAAAVGLVALSARRPADGAVHPLETPALAALVSAARLVEMLAVVLFVHALLSYTRVDIGVGGDPDDARAGGASRPPPLE